MKKILSFMAIAILLVSCGGKSEEKAAPTTTIMPETTEVRGDLHDYFEVVDKNCRVEEGLLSGDGILTVTLRRTDKPLPSHYKEYDPVGYFGATVKGNYGFGIILYNEAGDQLYSCRADETGLSGVYSTDDLKTLWELGAGEEGIVRWSVDGLMEMTGNMTFKISSICE